MPDSNVYLARAYAELEAVNAALFATREDGLKINAALEQAWEDIRGLGEREGQLKILRQVWLDVQVHLAVVQAEHPKAMDYFVRVKDELKLMIEAGKVPPATVQ